MNVQKLADELKVLGMNVIRTASISNEKTMAATLTEKQMAMLTSLYKACGAIRPKGRNNFVVLSLERRGLLTRSDFGDCRITNDGRVAFEATQKIKE